jgi:hypothetical protein
MHEVAHEVKPHAPWPEIGARFGLTSASASRMSMPARLRQARMSKTSDALRERAHADRGRRKREERAGHPEDDAVTLGLGHDDPTAAIGITP